ncbi:hypothetical protein BKA80DRAFT_310841 [Phyllosticta citrichinensis]
MYCEYEASARPTGESDDEASARSTGDSDEEASARSTGDSDDEASARSTRDSDEEAKSSLSADSLDVLCTCPRPLSSAPSINRAAALSPIEEEDGDDDVSYSPPHSTGTVDMNKRWASFHTTTVSFYRVITSVSIFIFIIVIKFIFSFILVSTIIPITFLFSSSLATCTYVNIIKSP